METAKDSVKYLKCIAGRPPVESSMPGGAANELARGAEPAEPIRGWEGYDLSAEGGFYRFRSEDFGAPRRRRGGKAAAEGAE